MANLLFDLVKYLLTALAATILFTDKVIGFKIIFVIGALAILIFILAIFITPERKG